MRTRPHSHWPLSSLGGTLGRFQQASERTKTVLIVPFFESVNGKYYNSAAVYDSGRLLGTYRKIHVPDLPLYRERFYFSPGDAGLPVFETSQGKIGVQICWDNLFPEGARALALKGAEIIFAPTAAALEQPPPLGAAISANAFANNIFIFRVNRVGKEDGISFYGRSFCVDPWGELVSELAGGKEAIVLADIDLQERECGCRYLGFSQTPQAGRLRRPGEIALPLPGVLFPGYAAFFSLPVHFRIAPLTLAAISCVKSLMPCFSLACAAAPSEISSSVIATYRQVHSGPMSQLYSFMTRSAASAASALVGYVNRFFIRPTISLSRACTPCASLRCKAAISASFSSVAICLQEQWKPRLEHLNSLIARLLSAIKRIDAVPDKIIALKSGLS